MKNLLIRPNKIRAVITREMICSLKKTTDIQVGERFRIAARYPTGDFPVCEAVCQSLTVIDMNEDGQELHTTQPPEFLSIIHSLDWTEARTAVESAYGFPFQGVIIHWEIIPPSPLTD